MNDLVSILVPVYNAENVISKCLESLLEQTYNNFEIILVDDCSTDNSYEVIKEWSRRVDNIFCYKNENNCGCAATINNALSKAKGEIIAIVDNDDYVEKDYIEYLLNLLKNAGADISICGWFNDDKEYRLSNKILSSPNALDELLLDTTFRAYYWNKLFKRKILGDKPLLEEHKFEDMASMPYIFKNAKLVAIGEEPKYHYLSGTGNFSASKKTYLNYWLSRAYYERLSFVIDNNVTENARNYVILKTCRNSIGSLRELKKAKLMDESKDLYCRIKANKKLFLANKCVPLKHKLYLLVNFI